MPVKEEFYTVANFMTFIGIASHCTKAVPGARAKVNAAIGRIRAKVRADKKQHDKPIIFSETDRINVGSIVNII